MLSRENNIVNILWFYDLYWFLVQPIHFVREREREREGEREREHEISN